MTRWLDEICESCGEQKEMYYRPWCALCEPPEPVVITALNLLKAMRHVDRKVYGQKEDYPRLPGREKVWDYLAEYMGLANDVVIGIDFPDIYDDHCANTSQGGHLGLEGLKYIEDLINEFNLRDYKNMQWEISW